ncbi:MAG: hypothetical protein ACE5JA_09790, partial [bacterium]
MNRISPMITWILLLSAGYASGQAPKVGHTRPQAGINAQPVTLHLYGDNFRPPPISSVKLIKSGYPDLVAASINVVSARYMTCSFDLVGTLAGLYDLVVASNSGSDTVPASFTVYSASVYPYVWKETTVGSGAGAMRGVAVGDGNGDGDTEVYGANQDSKIYQFKWDGANWVKTTVGSGTWEMRGVAVGDGNGDGEIEVYGANDDNKIYQFKWDGANWVKTTVGSGTWEMRGVAVGDGNGDGEMEVYGASDDYVIYQFKWDGTSWVKTIVGSAGDWMRDVGIGDGNGDEQMEVYGVSDDNTIYQFRWDGVSWTADIVGAGVSYMFGVAVGDGNADGEPEVYGGCWDRNVYQFKWNGASWVSTVIGSGGFGMFGVAVGDGDGDGQSEAYGACRDGNVYQFKWDGTTWSTDTAGSGISEMRGVAVGDGNSDGKMEVYGANSDNSIYQFKPGPFADIVLSDTSHDFGLVPVGDSLDWQYLIVRNLGNDTLLVDSLLSDAPPYVVVDQTYPDTLLPADSTLVAVRFKPVAQGGVVGTLWVYSNDPDEGLLSVGLTGEGYVPGIEEVRTVQGRFSFAMNGGPSRGEIIFSLEIPCVAEIDLRIYDSAGRLIDRLLAGRRPPGVYEIT